jgi:hypothetical protein
MPTPNPVIVPSVTASLVPLELIPVDVPPLPLITKPLRSIVTSLAVTLMQGEVVLVEVRLPFKMYEPAAETVVPQEVIGLGWASAALPISATAAMLTSAASQSAGLFMAAPSGRLCLSQAWITRPSSSALTPRDSFARHQRRFKNAVPRCVLTNAISLPGALSLPITSTLECLH